MKDLPERDLAVADELGRMADARIKELESENAALRDQLAQVEKERSDLQERLAEEIAKRVNENAEKAERPIPPRTWPKPWWG